jgi:2-polyprenyl-3-methyl-5-hydroxy-6-metoxy-1,4-benzoquinol methylase
LASSTEPRSLPLEPVACNLCGSREGVPIARGRDFEYDTSDVWVTAVRCAGCGLVYLNPRPAAAALPAIYPDNYYAYDFAASLNPLVRRVKDRVDAAKVGLYRRLVPGPGRILDVGCGEGHILDMLRRHGRPDWDLWGVELGERAVQQARRAGYTVLAGRFEDVALPPGHFDLLIMNQLIEHVADPVAMLKKARAALRPGGHVVIETPNLDSWDARLFRRRYWGGYHFPRHFTLFDRRTLIAAVTVADLETVACRPLVCPQFWILSLHHAALEHRWPRAVVAFLSFRNPLLLAPATAIEFVQKLVWWTSNLQLIARRPPTEDDPDGSAHEDSKEQERS